MFGRKRRDIDYDDFYRDDRDSELTRARPPRAFPHLVLLAVFAAATLGAVRATAGAPMFEAVLKSLASPCGIVWILLLVAAYMATLRRAALAALLCWTSWIVLTAGGNSWVASQAARSLEQPYLDWSSQSLEPLDVVLVLGGATSTDISGQPQLNAAGDRLLTAIKLYRDGKAKRFVCTGTRWQGLVDNELEIHEEQAAVLKAAGVDPQDIVELKAGTNTKTELDAFADWLEKNPAPRVGILSSAWHLPRVQRLADQRQIKFVALPSDFLTRRFKPDPNLLVPSSRNLSTMHKVMKEYLAEVVGR